MFFMVCSVYRGAKLLLKKPVNIDPADTVGTLFDRLPLESQSAHHCYLLPEDYVQVESSGIAISVIGTSDWISGPSVEHVNPNQSPITCGKLRNPDSRNVVQKLHVASHTLFQNEADLMLRKYCNIYTFVFA